MNTDYKKTVSPNTVEDIVIAFARSHYKPGSMDSVAHAVLGYCCSVLKLTRDQMMTVIKGLMSAVKDDEDRSDKVDMVINRYSTKGERVAGKGAMKKVLGEERFNNMERKILEIRGGLAGPKKLTMAQKILCIKNELLEEMDLMELAVEEGEGFYHYDETRGAWKRTIRTLKGLIGRTLRKHDIPASNNAIQTILNSLCDETPHQPKKLNTLPLIRFKNGSVDWSKPTFSLRDHKPEDYFTYSLNTDINWDVYQRIAKGETPECKGMDFIRDIVADDQDVENVLRMIGSCFQNKSIDKVFYLYNSEGSNGKSALIRYIISLVRYEDDKDTVSTVSYKHIAMNSTFEVFSLAHSLVNAVNGLTNDKLSDSRIIESILSGNELIFKQIYKKPIASTPVTTLIFACNRHPLATDNSWSYRKHIVPIYFPYVFQSTEHEVTSSHHKLRDNHLHDNLNDENDKAIFAAYVLHALKRLIRDSYQIDLSEASKNIMSAMKTTSSVIAGFVEEECKLGSTAIYDDGKKHPLCVPVKDLYEAYKIHCKGNIKVLSKVKFTEELLNTYPKLKKKIVKHTSLLGGQSFRDKMCIEGLAVIGTGDLVSRMKA